MARFGIIGWDMGALNAEAHAADASPGIVGSVSQESTIFRSGTGSLKLTPASGATGYWVHSSATIAFSGVRLRFYVRVTSLPATARRLLSTNATQLGILLNTTGTLSLIDQAANVGTSTVALTDTTRWYNIELGSVAGQAILRIDGVEQVNVASIRTGVGARFGTDDTVAATYTAYIDDAVTDTTDWPGDSKVTMLHPISDAQVGTWTGGTGGVTNLFDAVNNRPPIGTATETNLTQIESVDSSGNNATDEYRANLQTYATGGVGPSDTVRAIESLIWHGEDVASGTKTGSLAIISNPNVGVYKAFTFGADLGLLGTFPSNWVANFNATVDSPSVTIGSSPQIALRKTDATTGVSSVCYLGLKVEYIEHRSPPFSRRHRNYIIR